MSGDGDARDRVRERTRGYSPADFLRAPRAPRGHAARGANSLDRWQSRKGRKRCEEKAKRRRTTTRATRPRRTLDVITYAHVRAMRRRTPTRGLPATQQHRACGGALNLLKRALLCCCTGEYPIYGYGGLRGPGGPHGRGNWGDARGDALDVHRRHARSPGRARATRGRSPSARPGDTTRALARRGREGGGGGGGGAPDTVVTEYDDRSIVYIYCGLEVANHRKLFFLTKSTTGFYKVIRTYLSRLQIPNNVFQTNLLDTDHKNLQVIEVLNTNNVHGVSVEIEHMHNTNNFTTWYHIRFEEFADIDRLYRYWYPSRS